MNFPLWVARHIERIPASQQEQVFTCYRSIHSQNNILGAPIALRVQLLQKLKEPGMITLKQKLSRFVNRLDKIAVEISLQRYRHFFGLPVKSEELVSVDEALQPC